MRLNLGFGDNYALYGLQLALVNLTASGTGLQLGLLSLDLSEGCAPSWIGLQLGIFHLAGCHGIQAGVIDGGSEVKGLALHALVNRVDAVTGVQLGSRCPCARSRPARDLAVPEHRRT